jgi:hypothetical protein
MKKILIISDFFAPDNEIAAVRLTKIGKYLALAGYTVDVLKRGKSGRKEDFLLKKDLQFFNKIYENYNSYIYNILYSIIEGNNHNNISNKIKWKYISKFTFVRLIKNIVFYLINESINIDYCFTAISKNNLHFENYDFIFSSYGPKSSHLIGAYVKKKYRNIKWIADFRDSMNNVLTPKCFWTYCKLYEKKVLKNADIITVVSSGCFSLSSSKVHIIQNGFDEDDYPKKDTEQLLTVTDKYIFSYAGGMYGGRRKIYVFLQILKELINEHLIKRENIEIRYLGRSADNFLEQAFKFSLNDIIKNYGYVSREDSLIVQKESNALLLISWNDDNNQGIITGKFYEYLMAERPILCFISGNKANSELKTKINELNIGCCYEEANSKDDYCIMKYYIKEQLVCWKEGAEKKFIPNKKYIEKYNYRISIKNLIKLIETE